MDQPQASFEQHQAAGSKYGALGFAVVTMSDSRTPETDTSGQLIRDAVVAAGHKVVRYALVKDDPNEVRSELRSALADKEVAVIVTNGGTGISLRDNAYETVVSILEKPLDGFGEIFRMLSFAEVGSAAILSRARAGVIRGRPVFLLPGSGHAVELAMTRIVLPEIGHVLFELRRHGLRS